MRNIEKRAQKILSPLRCCHMLAEKIYLFLDFKYEKSWLKKAIIWKLEKGKLFKL